MNQFSGHILRRLVGSRWNKMDINKSCNQCHADKQRMAKVKIEDPETKQKNPVDYRWIHASESYARTLHSRILEVGDEKGASCLDCHIHRGEGHFGHDILKDEHKLASTHPDQLNKTCASRGCHDYAKSPFNQGFVKTDVHAIEQVHLPGIRAFLEKDRWQSAWHWGSILASLIALVFAAGSIIWLVVVYPKTKKSSDPLVGSELFEQVMLGRKPKKAPAKAVVAPKKPALPEGNAVQTPPSAESKGGDNV